MKSNYSRWTWARVTVNFLGFALLGLLWHHQVHHAAHKDTSSFQLVQPDLQTLYDQYNRGWFEEKLPILPVTWIDDASDKAPMAVTHGTKTEPDSIEMNRAFLPAQVETELYLFHEMCHVETWVASHKLKDQHGEYFQSCMRRLADEGAFNDLW